MKPKVVDGQHADCDGAMVSKLPNTTWPKGAFVETVKVWQQEWFYITNLVAPHGQPLLSLDPDPQCGSRHGPTRVWTGGRPQKC